MQGRTHLFLEDEVAGEEEAAFKRPLSGLRLLTTTDVRRRRRGERGGVGGQSEIGLGILGWESSTLLWLDGQAGSSSSSSKLKVEKTFLDGRRRPRLGRI